ncbi:MAG TPA: universal stress protein [Burkholderiales bacterium]|nr:universal stress protein [Burkholderiales bacterium]
MYKHILAATDGSRLSDKAINTAIELARTLGAKLTVFHATEPYPVGMYSEYAMLSDAATPGAWAKTQKKRADAILEKVRAKAAKAGVDVAGATSETMDPYDAILATAKNKRCDLIVMSSHGRRGLEGMILGSETHKVLTHGRLPVLVCR